MCAAGEPGQPWDFAARISGPVVVELTDPPRVRIAEAGLGHQQGRGQLVRGRIAKVRPDEAGHRIVREALDARSQAIVMPMPARLPSGKVLSKTLEIVLAKRPCRVIIDSVPAKPLVERRPPRQPAAV